MQVAFAVTSMPGKMTPEVAVIVTGKQPSGTFQS